MAKLRAVSAPTPRRLPFARGRRPREDIAELAAFSIVIVWSPKLPNRMARSSLTSGASAHEATSFSSLSATSFPRTSRVESLLVPSELTIAASTPPTAMLFAARYILPLWTKPAGLRLLGSPPSLRPALVMSLRPAVWSAEFKLLAATTMVSACAPTALRMAYLNAGMFLPYDSGDSPTPTFVEGTEVFMCSRLRLSGVRRPDGRSSSVIRMCGGMLLSSLSSSSTSVSASFTFSSSSDVPARALARSL